MSPWTIEEVSDAAAWEAAKALRFAVFVDEQGVPAAEELDALDAMARHWLLCHEGEPVGTARAVPKDGAWKIGRVAVRRDRRGLGGGLALMRAIVATGRTEGQTAFMLDSQTHAIAFYERLGFRAEGPEFLDAGMPHRRMVLRLPAAEQPTGR